MPLKMRNYLNISREVTFYSPQNVKQQKSMCIIRKWPDYKLFNVISDKGGRSYFSYGDTRRAICYFKLSRTK